MSFSSKTTNMTLFSLWRTGQRCQGLGRVSKVKSYTAFSIYFFLTEVQQQLSCTGIVWTSSTQPHFLKTLIFRNTDRRHEKRYAPPNAFTIAGELHKKHCKNEKGHTAAVEQIDKDLGNLLQTKQVCNTASNHIQTSSWMPNDSIQHPFSDSNFNL